MSSFSRRFKQVDICSFIFSTNSFFKVKEPGADPGGGPGRLVPPKI